jgi:hypothetical protein
LAQQQQQQQQQQQIIIHKESLRSYYEKVFKNLQKILRENCQIMSNAYIKLIEPKKRVKHPYKGRKMLVSGCFQRPDPNDSKPPWWPLGVRHIRPRYLRNDGKAQNPPLFMLDAPLITGKECIRLLTHILCDLDSSYGVTAPRLREADQTFRAQIPQTGWPLLDELYRVREEEENSPWAAPATPPDAVKDIPSEGSRGSRGSLTHDDEIAKETVNAHSDPRLSSIISQGDVPFNIPPTGRHHLFHSQNQFMHGDLPLHILPYHPPHFASSQAFIPDSYDELQSFPSQNIPTTALPGRDQYGGYINSYGFPYYYES